MTPYFARHRLSHEEFNSGCPSALWHARFKMRAQVSYRAARRGAGVEPQTHAALEQGRAA